MFVKTKTVEQRFWEKVIVKGADDCWEWQAKRDKDGYGEFAISHGNNHKAHRVSWLLSRGKPAGKLWVLHKCDNPPCVNPNHLFLGTATDNNRDASAKGRSRGGSRKGEDNHSHRLTNQDILDIRNKYASGKYTTIRLAEEYRTSSGGIHNILTGKNWGHIKTGIIKPTKKSGKRKVQHASI